MVRKHLSKDTKIIAVEYYFNNKTSYEKVAKIFKINEKTIRRWIEHYEKDELERINKQEVSYKVKQKHVDFALSELQKNQTITIQKLYAKIKKKYSDFDISVGYLAEVIRDNNYTRKRTKIRHYPETRYGKPIDFIKELKLFYKNVFKFQLNKIISIDETSIHAQIVNNYSRCEVGKRCVLKTTNNAVFKKYTLVCAINSRGIVGWILYEVGGMNSSRMVEFIDKFISGKYKNNVIIMDNGGSHKSKEVKQAVSDSKNTLLYSVPYRPKTNAIESFFSQLKQHFDFENRSINYKNLKMSVRRAIGEIKPQHYRNYMGYAYKTSKNKGNEVKESTRRKKQKIYKK